MDFGKRLRTTRAQRGYSQYELAAAVHVSPGTISHYENGSREPGASTLIQMSEVLNVSIDYLMGITDADIPPALYNKQFCKGTTFGEFIEACEKLDGSHRQLLDQIVSCIEIDQYVKTTQTEKKK